MNAITKVNVPPFPRQIGIMAGCLMAGGFRSSGLAIGQLWVSTVFGILGGNVC
jgi:hypothetical protein